MGFEPMHTNINGPKPFPLDRSGKLTMLHTGLEPVTFGS